MARARWDWTNIKECVWVVNLRRYGNVCIREEGPVVTGRLWVGVGTNGGRSSG